VTFHVIISTHLTVQNRGLTQRTVPRISEGPSFLARALGAFQRSFCSGNPAGDLIVLAFAGVVGGAAKSRSRDDFTSNVRASEIYI